MRWPSFFLGIAVALVPSLLFLGLVLFGVWVRERRGRRRPFLRVLRGIRAEVSRS